jgi:hypothetical protein
LSVTLPDLTPTACESSFREVALPGRRGVVTASFVNNGQVPARGRVNVVVYATTTGDMDGAVEIGRSDNVPVNLAAGRGKTTPVAVRLPSTVADYQFLAIVDDGNAMVETDDTNNTILSAGTVAVREAFVDLVTLDPRVHANQPGSRRLATVTLRNDGNVAAVGAVEMKLYASADRTLDVADTELLVVSGRRIRIRPGSSRAFRARFAVPPGMAAGDYYLIAAIVPDPRLSFLELVDTNLVNNVDASTETFAVA